MSKHLFVLITSLASLAMTAQVSPTVNGSLPGLINEASGLQCPNSTDCWTFNDSEDGSRLYHITDEGVFLGQTILQETEHIDYEDIARADDGRFFIGDFGNNSNQRTDLKIYITPDLSTSGGSTGSEIISFNLSDQIDFPPNNENLNFDIEGMIHWQDSLYLFTRNRTTPFNGLTKIYALNDESGSQTAELRTSFFGNLSQDDASISGADINPSHTRIALISRGAMYILTDFQSGFENMNVSLNIFDQEADYEGISFINDCQVLLVEESNSANIFLLNTCDIVSEVNEYQMSLFEAYTSDGHLIITDTRSVRNVQLLDSRGRMTPVEFNNGSASLSLLSSGLYLLIAEGEQGLLSKKILIH